MNIRSFLLLLSAFITFSIHAQTAKNGKSIISGDINSAENTQEYKLAADQSLTIAPNPLLRTDPILTISAVNVDIYGYAIINAGTAQIVELENLSGKPDGSIIDLRDSVELGTYIIRFDTNVGFITRKFLVI